MLVKRPRSTYFRIVSLFAALVVIGCGSQDSTDSENSGQSHNSTAVDRSELSGIAYFQTYCALCHGRNGEGTDDGPRIQQPIYSYSTWVVRNGRTTLNGGSMPDFSEEVLSESQLVDMLTWLRSIEKPTTGAGIYEVYCSHCHGVNGRGGESQQDITHDAHRSSEIFHMVRNGHGGNNYSDRGEYMPSWNDLEISDQEVQLIIGHLQELAK